MQEEDQNVLDEKEKKKCIQVFEQYDKKKQNKLGKEEIRKWLEDRGINPSDDEVEAVLTSGRNKEEYLTLETFLELMREQKMKEKEEKESELELAFQALGGDIATNQSIDKQKMINMIRHEFALTIDVNRLIKEMDLNADDNLDFQEFKKLLNS